MSPLMKALLLVVGLPITALLMAVAYRNWATSARRSQAPPSQNVTSVTWRQRISGWMPSTIRYRFWEEKWFAFLIGIALLHLILYFIPGNLYSFLADMELFWVGHLVLFLLFLFSKEDSEWHEWIKKNFGLIILRIWVAAFVITILVAGYKKLPDWFGGTGDNQLIATREWSREVRIPMGQHLTWQGEDNRAYEVQVFPSGKIYGYPRDRTRFEPVSEYRVTQVRFRSVDEDADSIQIDLRFTDLP